MFKKNKNIIITIIGVASLVGLFILTNSFPPDRYMPFGPLAAFILIYLVSCSFFYGIYNFAIGMISLALFKKKPSSSGKEVIYITVIGMMPVVFLAIQSIRDVTIMEILLIFASFLLICFYISRR